jgi:hypothetical protein
LRRSMNVGNNPVKIVLFPKLQRALEFESSGQLGTHLAIEPFFDFVTAHTSSVIFFDRS